MTNNSYFLQEGSNRILSKDQILVSCSHMICYQQKLHCISYFIDDFIQGMIKNPKLKEIHKVHQKICTEQVSMLLYCIAFKSEAIRINR